MAERLYKTITVSDQPVEHIVRVGMGNFVRIPVELLNSTAWYKLSPTACKVLIQMYSYRNSEHHDDQVWPGVPTLAAATGLSVATVYRAQQQIAAAKLAVKLARGYRHRGEVWELLVPFKRASSAKRSQGRDSLSGEKFSPMRSEELEEVREPEEGKTALRSSSSGSDPAQLPSSGSLPPRSTESDDGAAQGLNQRNPAPVPTRACLPKLTSKRRKASLPEHVQEELALERQQRDVRDARERADQDLVNAVPDDDLEEYKRRVVAAQTSDLLRNHYCKSNPRTSPFLVAEIAKLIRSKGTDGTVAPTPTPSPSEPTDGAASADLREVMA